MLIEGGGIMKSSYKNFKKENRIKLFGHEDAGKEEDSRFSRKQSQESTETNFTKEKVYPKLTWKC